MRINFPVGPLLGQVIKRLVLDLFLVLLLLSYLNLRVGAVLGRCGLNRVHRDFIRAVVRRLEHPMRALGVYISFLGSGRVHASRTTYSNVIRSTLFRLSGLSTCLRGLGGVIDTSNDTALLRPVLFGLRRLIRGIVHLIRVPSKGRITFSATFPPSLPLIATSPIRVTGVLDGLVRGTVGCSNSKIGVHMIIVQGSGLVRLAMASSNINVSTSRRAGIFRGFCHSIRLPSGRVPKLKLKLDCMHRVTRTRRKRISLHDRIKGNARMAMKLPVWGSVTAPLGVLFTSSSLGCSLLLGHFLRGRKCSITCAKGKVVILRRFPIIGPSLILLSVGVPNLGNFRITRGVQRGSHRILVFFLSSHSSGGSHLGNFDLGKGSCLTGPFCPRRLLTQVGRQFRIGPSIGIRRRVCRFTGAIFSCSAGRVHANGDGALIASHRTRVLHVLTHGPGITVSHRVVLSTM